jgi:hypothetical protein
MSWANHLKRMLRIAYSLFYNSEGLEFFNTTHAFLKVANFVVELVETSIYGLDRLGMVSTANEFAINQRQF